PAGGAPRAKRAAAPGKPTVAAEPGNKHGEAAADSAVDRTDLQAAGATVSGERRPVEAVRAEFDLPGEMAILPSRDAVLYPGMLLPFQVADPRWVRLLSDAAS